MGLNCKGIMVALLCTLCTFMYIEREHNYFIHLSELLGSRLENESRVKKNAFLCYISAGNLERLAQAWAKMHQNQDVNSLQVGFIIFFLFRR